MKIAILGFGTEGKAVADYFKTKEAEILIYDENETLSFNENPGEFHVGPDVFQRGIEADLIFKSPGILPEKVKHLSFTTVIDYFLEHCPCPVIGVTGTKGKGTTSTLIYRLLKKGGYDVYLGGNIGNPPLEFLDQLTPQSVVVLELSSFQTQHLRYSPHVAVLLRITPEHMDYHKDLQEYHQAKARLIAHQTDRDVVIFNADDPVVTELVRLTKAHKVPVSTESDLESGAQLLGEDIVFKTKENTISIGAKKEVGLLGAHNLENILPAVAVAQLFDLAPKTIRGVLRRFKGLPHRLEPAGTVEGVAYYNDSFSTTPETSIAGIRSFEKPLILLAGGSEKQSDFAAWAAACVAQKNLKAVILTGKASAERMNKAIETVRALKKNKKSSLKVIRVATLHKAIEQANHIAEPGDVVLLSPACASFEEFSNYKERGEKFKQWVKN